MTQTYINIKNVRYFLSKLYFALCSCCTQRWSRICRSGHWRADCHHAASADCVCCDSRSEQTSEAARFSNNSKESFWCYYKYEGTADILHITQNNHLFSLYLIILNHSEDRWTGSVRCKLQKVKKYEHTFVSVLYHTKLKSCCYVHSMIKVT